MKASIRIAALMLMLLPAVASAQAATPFFGAWEGAIAQDGSDELPVVVSFLTDSAEPTGLVFVSGLELSISEARISSGGVEFKCTRLRETDRDVPYSWIGSLVGDVIQFSVRAEDGDGPAFEVTLKKQVTEPR